MKKDISTVRQIMMEFAALTGLSPAGKVPRRYLWTDAFAVCNFLELFRLTEDEKYRDLALRLVDQVHNILGRHREDDTRTGWISGLDEEEGKKHPTIGGLRIGKEMKERKPSEPFDERLEWDRDGQYYHYLTKWMHALDRVSRATADPVYNRWAAELAKTAHSRFTYLPSPGRWKRMYWKMSIDLSRPLVRSMGHLDPLDGFITYCQLRATAAGVAERSERPDLTAEIADMALICEGINWSTDDPLGIGDLLCDAFKAAQMIVNADFEPADLPATMLDASLSGLESYARTDPLRFPSDYRLAFRELGLTIGLIAVEKLQGLVRHGPKSHGKKLELYSQIEDLLRYIQLGKDIQTFWLDSANRKAESWTEHREINMVMLATSLAPDGYLGL
jgi:hypothetical protein